MNVHSWKVTHQFRSLFIEIRQKLGIFEKNIDILAFQEAIFSLTWRAFAENVLPFWRENMKPSHYRHIDIYQSVKSERSDYF